MLHPLREATNADALRQLVQFQREVLAFACSPTTSNPPTEAEVQAGLSKAQGWFWAKLWKHGNPDNGSNELGRLLQATVHFMHLNPLQRGPALQAFDHDIHWVDDLTDASFSFEYRGLSTSARAAIAPLMKAFYTAILADGVPPEIHGGAGSIKLSDFKDAFWDANPELRACPACDRQKPDYVREKDTSDADHFFPKSLYPYLAVHPRNLVPICMECNQRAKLSRDPIHNHANSVLPSTFHPYDTLTGHPALQVTIQSQVAKAGALAVALSEGGASPTPRLTSVEEVWDLSERWSGRLQDAVEEILTAVREAGMSHRSPDSMGVMEFREWLSLILRSRYKEISKQPNRILQVGYLRYVLDIPSEFRSMHNLFNASCNS